MSKKKQENVDIDNIENLINKEENVERKISMTEERRKQKLVKEKKENNERKVNDGASDGDNEGEGNVAEKYSR